MIQVYFKSNIKYQKSCDQARLPQENINYHRKHSMSQNTCYYQHVKDKSCIDIILTKDYQHLQKI